MTVLINNGWLYLGDSSDYMLLYFEKCKWSRTYKGTKIKHIAGKTNYGFTTQVRWFTWKFEKVYALTHADYVLFRTIEDWQDDGAITMKVYRDDSNFIKFDGTNDSYTVMMPEKGENDWEKISFGDQDGPYRLAMLQLEQSS